MSLTIEPGKTYWIQVETVRFQVKTIRMAALPGWWLCEGTANRDPIIVPEKVLKDAEVAEDA